MVIRYQSLLAMAQGKWLTGGQVGSWAIPSPSHKVCQTHWGLGIERLGAQLAPAVKDLCDPGQVTAHRCILVFSLVMQWGLEKADSTAPFSPDGLPVEINSPGGCSCPLERTQISLLKGSRKVVMRKTRVKDQRYVVYKPWEAQ